MCSSRCFEKTRMILPVGKWIFEQVVVACKQAGISWQPDFLLSFNVSYLQILDGSFFAVHAPDAGKVEASGHHLMLS